MIECKELAGKVIHLCTIFEDGSDGPDLQIDFTDGTSFTVSLKTNVSIEAKCLRVDGGQPPLFLIEPFSSIMETRFIADG